MPSWFWIALTVTLGCTQALQVAMLGAMNRLRGPTEASWVSILGSLAGLSLGLAVQASAGRPLALPSLFAHPVVPAAVSLLAASLLLGLVQGIPAFFGLTGLLAVPYLLAASFLAPRIGVGLFLGAIITGQLTGGVLLDHLGAFGATPHPLDAPRLLGIGALIIGVLLIRGR